jgi:hypothetical protein
MQATVQLAVLDFVLGEKVDDAATSQCSLVSDGVDHLIKWGYVLALRKPPGIALTVRSQDGSMRGYF